MTAAPTDWRLEGTYLESCNCDAVCPCRRINGVTGGRSTHGICEGALSWHIAAGAAGGVPLDGLNVALACRYSDDEPGSPWSFLLFLDERADPAQREALAAIWTGRLGGSALDHFPWAWKESRLLGVRPARIELDHTPRRQWFRVGDSIRVRISGPVAGDATVTCVIPGHDRRGEELVAAELGVSDELLGFEYRGNCAYAADFTYAGH
jgi:hypothetical protein